jgi:carboxypeptidase Q
MSIRPRITIVVAAFALLATRAVAQPSSGSVERYRATADRLIDAALSDTTGYHHLALLVDRFGSRLSGSKALDDAIDWVLAEMRRDGLENVRGEPVMVPHWVRGRESAALVSPRAYPLHMLGLGGSVATRPAGITASLLVVSSFDELKQRAAEAKGKIILFDYPFPLDKAPFDAYGDAVRYRGAAATEAARAGAVAALIRSVASFSIQSPHTGAMRYADSTVARIPAAALSVEDAEMLHRMFDRGERPVVRLAMEARLLPDAPSRNVVAELRGSARPDEVVVLGGHIDSWDVGQGAMDDGGGSVAAWEAVRLMKQLGLRPRRTVRVVLWTNEENGGRGSRGYRDAHAGELGKHVAAMESDNGIFTPRGFRLTGSDSALGPLREVARLLERIGATSVGIGDPEADVTPLANAQVPALALDIDASRYFWYHHSQADMLNVVDRQDFAKCVAAMAVMAYVLADADQPLPRAAAPAAGR